MRWLTRSKSPQLRSSRPRCEPKLRRGRRRRSARPAADRAVASSSRAAPAVIELPVAGGRNHKATERLDDRLSAQETIAVEAAEHLEVRIAALNPQPCRRPLAAGERTRHFNSHQIRVVVQLAEVIDDARDREFGRRSHLTGQRLTILRPGLTGA